MKLRLLLIAFAAQPIFQLGAIDLSPRWTETEIDGIPNRQLYFADGSKKFGLSLDRETEVSAGLGGTVFRFPKLPDIEFFVKESPLTPASSFDPEKLDVYRTEARNLLPAAAQEAEIESEVGNPLPINSWKSYRFAFRFKRFGRACTQTVTFLNLNDRDQIVMVVGAPHAQWEEADARSWQIVRSWHELLPGDVARQGN
jgi:hypothetical protein